ncbi:MAG TPA: pyridoxal-phosphate dependent enzyme [Thermodesulfobacteriota bacterium]|nr:pyridoxal-phosphate dependent enzyme [Thermodesulfobacteriota bacterium]
MKAMVSGPDQNTDIGVIDLIGNTPLVRVSNLNSGPCELFLKLESQNPSGSVKDRIALSMIEAAESSGRLKAGGIIVEATAGNTGLGLALLATLKGYKIILVVPDKMSREKIQHCKALGADVRITRSDVGIGHPEYYQDMAKRIAAETRGFYVDQFSNPANPWAHEEGTGPEIWRQMGERVDAVVCGVGSGGTMTGTGRFFRKIGSRVEMVLADPEGSILAPLVNTGKTVEPGSWLVEGIGEDFVPPNLDITLVKKAYSISDAESFSTARDLLLREGILAGSSSGTLLAAALRYCREQKKPKRVVTFVCDRGDKYLSKAFSDPWLKEQGFESEKLTRTVRDLVMRRHDTGETIFVRPQDNLKTAYKRMRLADVDQLPVLSGMDEIVGLLDENSLLSFIEKMPADQNPGAFPVSAAARKDFVTVKPEESIRSIFPMLAANQALAVVSKGHFVGLITKVDLLNYLFMQGNR